nr:hypothetical protein [Haloferax sp. ATB1]
MPDERIRTVVASLVEPTSNKEQKLLNLRSTYREALCEAFDANATTMTAVNDIVTPYDLPYQAKDALKRHVPGLLKSGSAELSETQPSGGIRSFHRPDARILLGSSPTWPWHQLLDSARN